MNYRDEKDRIISIKSVSAYPVQWHDKWLLNWHQNTVNIPTLGDVYTFYYLLQTEGLQIRDVLILHCLPVWLAACVSLRPKLQRQEVKLIEGGGLPQFVWQYLFGQNIVYNGWYFKERDRIEAGRRHPVYNLGTTHNKCTSARFHTC